MEENFECVKDPVAKKLLESVSELMMTQKLDDIRTSQILEKSGVSRSTFYRRYTDKYDLINKSYSHVYEVSLDRVKDGMTYDQAFRRIYDVLSVKPVFFKHAFEATAPEAPRHFVWKRTYDVLRTLLEGNGVDMTDQYNERLLAGYVSGTLKAFHMWIDEGMKEDFDYIYNMNFDLMPNTIRKCLIIRYGK